jgi:fatty-acyl-CoA synthase
VAFAGAIGQPDAFAGELPAVYVELVAGAVTTEKELLDHAAARIQERAAIPKHLEILDELPKTPVGKIFKPELRCRAIRRVLDGALAEARANAQVEKVAEDRKRGLVAYLVARPGCDRGKVAEVMGKFALQWDWAT